MEIAACCFRKGEEIIMGKFEIRDFPEFSWSYSRHKLVGKCETCYGLHYYVAHNGWLKEAEALSKSAYRYKKTRSVKEAMSQIMSGEIHNHFYHEALTAEAMKKKIRTELNNMFIQSRDKKEDWFKQPSKVSMLKEMVNFDTLNPVLTKKTLAEMDLFITNFFAGVTMAEIMEETVVWHKANNFNSFVVPSLDDLTIFAGLNVVYERASDGCTVVVNYKTDDEPSEKTQLGAITLYLTQEKGIRLDNIIIRDEFLKTGTFKEYKVDAKLLKLLIAAIEDSVGMMSELLVDGDWKRNEPLALNSFTRNPKHGELHSASNCPYCESVRKDIEKYPQGYFSFVNQKVSVPK